MTLNVHAKNNKYDNMHDEFAWHIKLVTNQLRFISLFVVINEMTERLSNLSALETQLIPAQRKEVIHMK